MLIISFDLRCQSDTYNYVCVVFVHNIKNNLGVNSKANLEIPVNVCLSCTSE